jgi:type VI secretion system protein ImpL
MMSAILRFLASRWVLSAIGLVPLAALVWWFGPFLDLLEDALPRLLAVLAMVLIWAVANLLLDAARRKRDQALRQGVAGDGAAEEALAVAARLSKAMDLLKQRRGARGYLYEQPWYAIIGPPGSGKTTALMNAGLSFPLAAEMGQGAVAGVGGTRLCDWWFTEDAVMIDTAGRYTTQDSDATIDRAGWEAFLALMRRTRPRQPLNGVIVALAMSDIALASPAERSGHARVIRARVLELESKLGIRLPVYALFTKSDLIAGFTEYFDDLDREGRAQVWGITFDRQGSAVAQFAAGFSGLVEQLQARLLSRLQSERGTERRPLIAGFPAQVASLAQPLTMFLEEAFGGTGAVPLLRGAYLTSGTQEGTPIDRLTGLLSRDFGLDQRRAPSLRPEAGRSYFLGRLLTQVIFGEAMLVSDNPAARRRSNVLRLAACGVALLAVLAAGGVLFLRQSSEVARIDAMAASLAAYEQTASGLKLDPVADADLATLAPLLDQARDLPYGDAHPVAPSAALSALGLDQADKLAAGARLVYRHALERALLPRLLWRLEAQMRGNLLRPDFLYEATRIYLMLGNAGPLDRALVTEWLQADWQIAYAGAERAGLREGLSRHLAALLGEALPQVALDGGLLAQARETFGRIPLAARVYARIKPSAAAQRLAPWRASEALGPAGQRLFLRGSGKPLNEGIPGLYTLPGFQTVLLPALPAAARSIAAEGWVLGRAEALDANGPAMAGLQRDVVALYEADYIDVWDRMLADLNVAPLRSVSQAAQSLYILSSTASPLRSLLTSVVAQVSLSKAETKGSQTALQGTQAAAVEQHFAALRGLMGEATGIDQPLQALSDLQQLLAKIAAAPIGSAPPALTGPDPAVALRGEAVRQPQPLQRWLLSIDAGASALRSGSPKQQIVAAYNGPGGPGQACALAAKGRYPFDRNGVPITLEDFARLFAPGGLLDGFFNTQLRGYVGPGWKLAAQEGNPAPLTQDDLGQFQRAALIRDTFFADGSATPRLRLDVMPVSIDAGARAAGLRLDGVDIIADRAPPRTAQMTWPGPVGGAIFAVEPVAGTGEFTEQGPWAVFKLFDRAQIKPVGDHAQASFRIGERQAVFDVKASGAMNPLLRGALQEFRCPVVQ